MPLKRIAARKRVSAHGADAGHRLRVALRDVLREVFPLHRLPPAAPSPLALDEVLRGGRLALVMVVPEVPPDARARILCEQLVASVPLALFLGRSMGVAGRQYTGKGHGACQWPRGRWRGVGDVRDVGESFVRRVGCADGLPVACALGMIHIGRGCE